MCFCDDDLKRYPDIRLTHHMLLALYKLLNADIGEIQRNVFSSCFLDHNYRLLTGILEPALAKLFKLCTFCELNLDDHILT